MEFFNHKGHNLKSVASHGDISDSNQFVKRPQIKISGNQIIRATTHPKDVKDCPKIQSPQQNRHQQREHQEQATHHHTHHHHTHTQQQPQQQQQLHHFHHLPQPQQQQQKHQHYHHCHDHYHQHQAEEFVCRDSKKISSTATASSSSSTSSTSSLATPTPNTLICTRHVSTCPAHTKHCHGQQQQQPHNCQQRRKH
ncbi:sex-determining region Y protein-like [Musca domestica]|uniref:Sex-determining region Y protein-like n=1 Tax=Musca domestica TaxID=7370 RepID=A0ABM3VQQ8_MUSDO|nr:sex-determining region Y protein-like [Musca domestica]